MSSWTNIDANTSAPKWAATQVNLRPTQANIEALFDNTTANSFAVTLADGSVRQGSVTYGLFAVDANEEQVAEFGAHGPHTGWTLRTVGQGGRAGRVTHEVLVALANVTGDTEDTVFKDAIITISSQPATVLGPVSAASANTLSYSVTAAITSGNTAAPLRSEEHTSELQSH